MLVETMRVAFDKSLVEMKMKEFIILIIQMCMKFLRALVCDQKQLTHSVISEISSVPFHQLIKNASFLQFFY